VVPTFVVGVVFFRVVLSRRWALAAIGAALLVSVGFSASVARSYWLKWLMYGE